MRGSALRCATCLPQRSCLNLPCMFCWQTIRFSLIGYIMRPVEILRTKVARNGPDQVSDQESLHQLTSPTHTSRHAKTSHHPLQIVRAPALTRATRPNVDENYECLGAQSQLTTAGDAGENAVCLEAQSTNKIHEKCFACASTHNHWQRFTHIG